MKLKKTFLLFIFLALIPFVFAQEERGYNNCDLPNRDCLTTTATGGNSSFNATYNNLLNQECPAGNYAYKIQLNGTILCRIDLTGNSSNFTSIFAGDNYTYITTNNTVNINTSEFDLRYKNQCVITNRTGGTFFFGDITIVGNCNLPEVYTTMKRFGHEEMFANLSDATRPCRYSAYANINITTGTLTMEGCTLEMNETTDADWNLYVYGVLIANYSNITRGETIARYRFQVFPTATVTLKNSYISYTGDTDGDMRRGLSINTTNLVFENNTLSKAYVSDVEILSSNISLIGSRFLGNGESGTLTKYNIFCKLCNNVKIVDSNISGASITDVVVAAGQNLTILDSNFSTFSTGLNALLINQKTVNVNVIDEENRTMYGAIVDLFNISNVEENSGTTDMKGNVFLVSTEYRNDTLGKVFNTPFNVSAVKVGYTKNDSAQINISQTQYLRIQLFPSVTGSSTITNIFDQWLNTTNNVTFKNISGDFFFGDGRNLLNLLTYNSSYNTCVQYAYNQTTPAITYANANFYNNSANINTQGNNLTTNIISSNCVNSEGEFHWVHPGAVTTTTMNLMATYACTLARCWVSPNFNTTLTYFKLINANRVNSSLFSNVTITINHTGTGLTEIAYEFFWQNTTSIETSLNQNFSVGDILIVQFPTGSLCVGGTVCPSNAEAIWSWKRRCP